MSKLKVLSYDAKWSAKQHKGEIVIHSLQLGGLHPTEVDYAVEIEDPKEMHFLVDLLRNEKPVYFDLDMLRFSVTSEPTGEEES